MSGGIQLGCPFGMENKTANIRVWMKGGKNGKDLTLLSLLQVKVRIYIYIILSI
jgi:hypothetical protein